MRFVSSQNDPRDLKQYKVEVFLLENRLVFSHEFLVVGALRFAGLGNAWVCSPGEVHKLLLKSFESSLRGLGIRLQVVNVPS